MRTSYYATFLLLFTLRIAIAQPPPASPPQIRVMPGNAPEHVVHSVVNLPLLNPAPPAFYTRLWWFGDNYFSFKPQPEHLYRNGFGGNDMYVIHTPNYGTGGPPPLAKQGLSNSTNVHSNESPIVNNGSKLQLQSFRNAVPGDTVYLIVSYQCPVGSAIPNLPGFIKVTIPPPYDALLSLETGLVNSSLFPNDEANVPGLLRWQFEAPTGGADRSILIPLKTSMGMEPHIGDEIPIEVELQYENGVQTTESIALRVAASHDPNGMFPSIYKDDDCVMDAELIDYHVCFQNTGNAPTNYVRVECKLDPHLNLSTVQLLRFHTSIAHCGSGGQGTACHTMSVDSNARKVIFEFQNFELEGLHDVACKSAEATKGWLEFSVLTDQNYRLGADIVCHSEIYFDNHAPISTNDAITTCPEKKKFPVDKGEPTPMTTRAWWWLLAVVAAAIAVVALVRKFMHRN